MIEFVQRFLAGARRARALILLAGAAIVLFALAYWLLIEPPVSGIARLQRVLPQTRVQAAQLAALLAERKACARARKSRPSVPARPGWRSKNRSPAPD